MVLPAVGVGEERVPWKAAGTPVSVARISEIENLENPGDTRDGDGDNRDGDSRDGDPRDGEPGLGFRVYGLGFRV